MDWNIRELSPLPKSAKGGNLLMFPIYSDNEYKIT